MQKPITCGNLVIRCFTVFFTLPSEKSSILKKHLEILSIFQINLSEFHLKFLRIKNAGDSIQSFITQISSQQA